jgi:hypothetical protein
MIARVAFDWSHDVKPGASYWLALLIAFSASVVLPAQAWESLAVQDDELVRMPGTQPDQGVNLENPNRCLNCHSGLNSAGEPGLQWMGSMMGQAARDPLWWASVVVAAQDSIWALGNPNATDICLRCHMPEGWLGGRSDPTNATAMTGSDFDGVHCDVCHRMWDPFFDDSFTGVRESSDWSGYWDEFENTGPGSGTLSQSLAEFTRDEDRFLAADIRRYIGDNFFDADGRPISGEYKENASGQYFVSPNADKRASFADADARHQMLYSRYHKSKYFCGTCHDISNPVFANLDSPTGEPLPTEQYSASQYFHVERTFSEFMLSVYGRTEGGAPTNPEFQAQGAPDIMNAAKCQDCHMRDISGKAANKKGTVFRPDDSLEHPNSGVPLHDLTGGNSWITHILGSLDPNGPVYDPVNVAILDKGPSVLTLDLNAGQSPKLNGAALKAGSDRAKQQLLLAATIKSAPDGLRDAVTYDSGTGALSFIIKNNTGHKLITGFPEGRRMFVNIKAYFAGDLIQEVNPYDFTIGTLKGLHLGSSPDLSPNEVYVDELVYESHPSSSLTGEDHTFHFVLGDGRSKDNRIPPKGFDKVAAAGRISEPVYPVGYDDPYTDQEFIGGYDAKSLMIVSGADFVEVTLYYQGTSREYIEFLRDEINGTIGKTTLTSPTPSGEPQAYVIQTDPFFAQLKAWGNTIWDLWWHNHGFPLDADTPGADPPVAGIVPFAMAQATYGAAVPPPGACDAPETPLDLAATGAKRKVVLTWGANNPAPSGYRVYYDLAGKLQHLDDTLMAAYTDTGLRPSNEFCYAVTAWNDCEAEGAEPGVFDEGVDEESGTSNVACAVATRK